MRLWTLHPRYLDAKGLVAAWREALLAQMVLAGKTAGYRHHPQLARFQSQSNPSAAIATFLAGLAEEARARGYNFDENKISSPRLHRPIAETKGQLLCEWGHLQAKLRRRSPQLARKFRGVVEPEPHPLFRIVPGRVQPWEKNIASRPREIVPISQAIKMKAKPTSKVRDDAQCKVTGGTHAGKSGVVRDINTGKTGHVTITVVQASGDRFKTLAKNVSLT